MDAEASPQQSGTDEERRGLLMVEVSNAMGARRTDMTSFETGGEEPEEAPD
jgi:hypothetical protein